MEKVVNLESKVAGNGAGSQLRQRVGYGTADMACNLIWTMISLYLMYFYTDVFGLAPAVVGFLFLFTRIIDGCTDVIMGIIIDKTRTKWGQSRPYFLWGIIPFCLFAILAFYVPDIGETGKIIYAYITYIGLSCAYTMVNVPLSSVLPRLTNDTQERAVLVSYRTVFASIGATIATMFALPLVSYLGSGNDQKGFFLTMVIFGVAGAVLFLITFLNIRETVELPAQKMDVRESFKAIKGNKPWLIVTFNIMFLFGGLFFQSGVLMYFYTYYVGNPALGSIVATLMNLVPIAAYLVTPFITKRMYKKNAYQIGAVISLIGYMVIWFAGPVAFGLILGNAIASFGFGIRVNLHWSLAADPIDYGEYLSGVNAAGLMSAFSAMSGKVVLAIVGAVTSFLLATTGYVANGTQPDAAIFAIRACYVLIPAAMVVCSMILMSFYDLDAKYDEVKATLEKRRAEAQK